MFWKTLNLVVNLTFLLLAVTIMTILLRNDLQRGDFSNYESVLQSAKQEIHRVNQSNFIYLEGKTNAVASNQDSYQTNTARRLDVLEQRIKNLEDKKGNNPPYSQHQYKRSEQIKEGAYSSPNKSSDISPPLSGLFFCLKYG